MGQCCIPSCRTAYTSMQEHRGPLSLCRIGVWPSQPLRGVTKGNKFCTCTQCNPSQEMLPLSDVKMLPLRHSFTGEIIYIHSLYSLHSLHSRNSFFFRFPVRTMLSENIASLRERISQLRVKLLRSKKIFSETA